MNTNKINSILGHVVRFFKKETDVLIPLSTHPDCGVHASCGQSMNASIRAVLEVQTVDWLLVVPCNLTRYHLHFFISNTDLGRQRIYVSTVTLLHKMLTANYSELTALATKLAAVPDDLRLTL